MATDNELLQAILAELTANKAELVQLRGDVGRIDSRLESVEANAIESNGRLARMEKSLASIEEDLHVVRADTTTIRADVGSIRTEANGELVELRGRVARLEAAVFKPAAE